MNTSQTIIVPDERGCYITVPLTSPEVIRVMLKVGVRDLTHRAKLEKFILQKYFPSALNPVVVQEVVERVVERTIEVEKITEVTRDVTRYDVLEKEKEDIVEEEVQDLISSLMVEEVQQKESNEVEEIFDNNKEEEKKDKIEEINVQVSENFYTKDQDIRRCRDSDPVDRMVEESFFLKNYDTQYTMSVITGQVKSLRSYHLCDMQIDITGHVTGGEFQIYTKRNNELEAPWELYVIRDFEGTAENRIRVKIKNDQVMPIEIDINGPMIRQMQIRFDLQGRKGSEVRIRISTKMKLIGWRYSHYIERKKLEESKPKRIRKKK